MHLNNLYDVQIMITIIQTRINCLLFWHRKHFKCHLLGTQAIAFPPNSTLIKWYNCLTLSQFASVINMEFWIALAIFIFLCSMKMILLHYEILEILCISLHKCSAFVKGNTYIMLLNKQHLEQEKLFFFTRSIPLYRYFLPLSSL